MKYYKDHRPYTYTSLMINIFAILCSFFIYTNSWYTSKLYYSKDLITGINKNCTFYISEKLCYDDNWRQENISEKAVIHNITN